LRKENLVNGFRDGVSLHQEAERVILLRALAIRDESVAHRASRVTTSGLRFRVLLGGDEYELEVLR
jgi:hypothetical protein